MGNKEVATYKKPPYFDTELCLVAPSVLLDEQYLSIPASERPRKWSLCCCTEGYDYKVLGEYDQFKKFGLVYPASQIGRPDARPYYVEEKKNGEFVTQQGYPVVYIGRIFDEYGLEEAEGYFRKLFNNNDETYDVFFNKIFHPAMSSGLELEALSKAQRALSAAQSPPKEQRKPRRVKGDNSLQDEYADEQTL